MHLTPSVLLALGAAAVGLVHAVLPDHWVPLAVVARAERWSMARLGAYSALAAAGHILTSVLLGGVVALVGLQFQKQVEAQQGHIVGAVLLLTGLGLLVWNASGRGHPHAHDQPQSETHVHQHDPAQLAGPVHEHEHAHGTRRHSHRHSHEAFVQQRSEAISSRSSHGRLASLLVSFGVAASPDLSFLPLSIGAAAYGAASVATVLGVFAVVTFATFVGLTVIATVIGYQMRGEWLENHAGTITAIVLIAIGAVAFLGL